MVDDFWGEDELNNFLEQMKQHVFPEDRVLTRKSYRSIMRFFGACIASRRSRRFPASTPGSGPGGHMGGPRRQNSQTVHYLGIEDDKDRLMAIICHNTDLGDGWEREGENEEYFHEFSEKKSYPMGINIVTYAMTH